MIVFSHLDKESYAAAMHVCTRWNRVANRSDTKMFFAAFWATQLDTSQAFTVELEQGHGQRLGLSLKKRDGGVVNRPRWASITLPQHSSWCVRDPRQWEVH